MRFVFIPLVIAVVTVVAALLLAVPSQPMPYLIGTALWSDLDSAGSDHRSLSPPTVLPSRVLM